MTGPALQFIAGTVWPLYASYKSIQTNDGESITWLSYWMMFALFSSVEFILDAIFAMWMPLWFELKLVFVLWLQPIKTGGGAMLLYHKLEPIIQPKTAIIDGYIAAAKEKCSSAESIQTEITKGIDWAKETYQKYTGKPLPGTDAAPKASDTAAKEVQDDQPQEPDDGEVLVDPKKND